MKTLFLNATQHNLTDEQIKYAKELYNPDEFVNLKDLNPDLFDELKNSPSTYNQLSDLAEDFIQYLIDLVNVENKKIILHLPIGSPAFMFIFAQKLDDYNWLYDFVKPIFSHTDRISVEIMNNKGELVKQSKFMFIDFIEVV